MGMRSWGAVGLAVVIGVVGLASPAHAAITSTEADFCRYLQEQGLDRESIYATGSCTGESMYVPLTEFLPGTDLARVLTSPNDGNFDRNFLIWAPVVSTDASTLKSTRWSHCSEFHAVNSACAVGKSTFVDAHTPEFGFSGPGRFRVGRDGAFVGMFCANFSENPGGGEGPVPVIEGTKYHDLDGDGRRDSGEPGLEGFTIELWQGGTKLATDVSGSDGHYAFRLDAEENTAITYGEFRLKEVQKDGWVQSEAPAPVSIGLAQGGTAREVDGRVEVSDRVLSGRDFGNYRPVSVSGSKVEDMDADGSPQGDPGVEGWGVTVSRGGSDVAAVTTGADGTYRVDGLRPGTYTITEEERAGWVQSAPADGSYTVTLRSGEEATGRTFANWRPATITGRKFDDHAVDGSGEGDPGLPGWVISAVGESRVSATTGEDGGYTLTGLRPGEWTVEEELQEGWRQTAPASGTHSLRLRSGMTVADTDFGNVCLGGTDVTVRDIADGAGVEGLTVRLDEVDVPGILDNEPALPRTNDSGSFRGLLPGTYEVTVFLPENVFTTDPDAHVVDGRWAIVKTVTVEECARAGLQVEVFRSSRGKVTGGMKEVQVGGFATAGGVFMTKNGEPTGHLEFNDHVVPFSVNTSDIRGIWVDDSLTNAWIWGVLELDGQDYRFRLHVVDAGEPGTHDRYELSILDRYEVGYGEVIEGGNIQIHDT